MYREIYDYAVQKGLTTEKYRKGKTIAAHIILDEQGNYIRVEAVPKDSRKRVSSPDAGSGNPTASPIVEKRGYVFYRKFINPKGEDETYGNPVKLDSWNSIMHEGADHVEELTLVCRFLDLFEENDAVARRVLQDLNDAGVKDAEYISFRINEMNLETSACWCEWFDSYMSSHEKENSADRMISELTGQEIIPVTGTFPKNTAKVTGTGAPIFSNNHKSERGPACAFKSYGANDSKACPMSEEEANAVKAGLEYLLESDRNHDTNFEIIYWYDHDDAIDLITRSLNMNRHAGKTSPDQIEELRNQWYQNVLQEVFGGSSPGNVDAAGRYHIVSYNVPDKGRFRMYNMHMGTYGELYTNLQKWYQDSCLSRTVKVQVTDELKGEKDASGHPQRAKYKYLTGSYTINNIYAVFFQLMTHKNVKDKNGEVKNEFGADRDRMLYAMYENRQIPVRIYRKALDEVIRGVLNNGYSERIPLQIIKVFLRRDGLTEMKESLNTDAGNTAYNCGRWFAAMDELQRVSSGYKVGVTLSRKFYKSVKLSPAKVLTMVTNNKENYLGKLKSVGQRKSFIQLFGEVGEKIGSGFPEKFSVSDQGAFDLGFAQQKQEFMLTGNRIHDGESTDAIETASDNIEEA
jgi:hypothetical protein